MNPLIQQLAGSANPKYIKTYDQFVPGKDSVLYSGPYWDQEEIAAMLDAVCNGDWIVSGNLVERFQEDFSRKFNVQYSHMVNSGSSANLSMITAVKKLFSWQDGDEIIVSPVGFPTTIAPIIQNNLKPCFVDIEFDSLNFDVSLIESKINLRTRAVIVSPVLGNPPDLIKIKDICDRHGLVLLGDNCDSLGSKINGRYIHEYYYAWSCSFYPAHHISTGEGGMVSTNDEDLIKLVRSISWWGRDCYCVGTNNLLSCGTCGKRFDYWLKNYDGIIDHKYIYNNVGYNLKPLDLQGAIGSVQLTKFDAISQRRKINKARIEQKLHDHIGLNKVKVLDGYEPCWFGVPVICEEAGQKELLVSHFESHKIQTRNYFGGNILYHPGYEHLDDYRDYPNSNKTLDQIFFLGCAPIYNEQVLDYIDQVIEKW